MEKMKKNSETVRSSYISDTFRRYMRAKKRTPENVAKSMACTSANISYLLRRDDDLWRVGEIMKFAEAIECPMSLFFSERCSVNISE